MADENMIFHQEVAPSANAYGTEGTYFASSTHVVNGSQNAFTTVPFVHLDAGLPVAGIGATVPTDSAMLNGTPAAAGYDATEAVPVENVPLALQPRPARTDGDVVPFKVAWTTREDTLLKEMVRRFGEGKWAEIAVYLPHRTGKQCRERWTNQLRPDIKNDVWTEHDDRALIEAHRMYSNRWSTIAQHLPGRSENSVKNHWNATKRSLKSNRKLKKKNSEQPAPGQFTLLEQYIRSCLSPTTDNESPIAPATDNEQPIAPADVNEQPIAPVAVNEQPIARVPTLSFIGGNHGGSGTTPYGAAKPAPVSNLQGMEMTVDKSAAISSMNHNTLVISDLKAYGVVVEKQNPIVPFECLPSYDMNYGGGELTQTMFSGGDTEEAADTNLGQLFPFAENDVVADQLEWESYGSAYYNKAAPNSANGSSDLDDFDAVQMAFLASEDEAKLDMPKFK